MKAESDGANIPEYTVLPAIFFLKESLKNKINQIAKTMK